MYTKEQRKNGKDVFLECLSNKYFPIFGTQILDKKSIRWYD